MTQGSGAPKKYTVGVDIGHTYIKLAKTERLSDKSYELLDYLDIALNTQVSLRDPKFLEHLKSGLDQILGDGPKCDIWAAIPSAKVETRSLRIPKLTRKQIPNAIYWTFTKKVDFNDQEEILDYETIGEIVEGGAKKIEVMAFKTPKAEVADLKLAFHEIGYPLKGITIVPFAVQNLFRTEILTQEEQDACCLFVGRDWSRIAMYSNGNLILSRGIKAGMRSMVEAINTAMLHQDGLIEPEEANPRDNGETTDQRIITIQPAAQRIFFDFIGAPQGRERVNKDTAYDPAQVFQMLLPAMERLLRQVERTFEHYSQNFHREGVRRIYLSGQITANPTLVNYIGRQLDMPIEVMNPFTPETPFVRPINIPDTQAERESFVPAIGLALSNNARTPNVLFTHQDRNRQEDIRRINLQILTGCMLCLIAFIGLFSWQERRLDAKREQLDKLNQQLLEFNPPVEKDFLLALYAQNKSKHQAYQDLAQRYAPAALLNELAQITPNNIRLLSVEANFPKDKSAKDTGARTIFIEGIIFSETGGFENILTGYLLSLKNSPIIGKPSVQIKRTEIYNAQEVMRFRAKLELL
ncbi:MAG: pilus assembly protein PilM [Desulfobacterales bacterium]|nr:pilus assembly protein PilM [Desulfobacterales bacterium]